MEDSEAQRPSFLHARPDGHPRIEIVIEKRIIRLTVDGEATPESVAELTALANGLGSGDPVQVTPAVASDALPARREEPRYAGPVAGTFRVAKGIVTDLLARLVGHVLGFPP